MPLGAPLTASPEAPIVQGIVGVFFLIFLIGAAYQIVRIRAVRRARIAPPESFAR